MTGVVRRDSHRTHGVASSHPHGDSATAAVPGSTRSRIATFQSDLRDVSHG
jgi:hypothetical protein